MDDKRSAHVLEADGLVKTLLRLQLRISERFPKRGLGMVCMELIDTAKLTAERAEKLRRANVTLYAISAVVVALGIFGVYALWRSVGSAGVSEMLGSEEIDFSDAAQALDSIVNLIIVGAILTWFLVSLDTRLKRRMALRRLGELRSHAHVVDMRQLAKDPISIRHPSGRTASSPDREMTPFELARYLSYCSEMLLVIGKLAELYGQNSSDPEVVAAASDVDTLCNEITQKIWQKLMVLNAAGLNEREGL